MEILFSYKKVKNEDNQVKYIDIFEKYPKK